jgi:O-antigen biosynthesis protein WbqV
LVEANPVEGVRTNVLGTANLADACADAGVPVMVQISTDKAVNPSSIMGATKRIAERYCQALDLDGDVATRFITVRFGNVLGSTGSVVPLFQKQLARGGPLTVTHPDMKRYFMTAREAVELVLQASAAGAAEADKAGKIYVLDMGEPVRIIDLAHQMIKLAGLRPDTDVAIEFTGPRPGEKLFEEVFHGGETLVSASQKGLLLAAPRAGDRAELRQAADDLLTACEADDLTAIMACIRALVPEYGAGGDKPAQAASG